MEEVHGIIGKATMVLEAKTGQSSKDSSGTSRCFRKHGLPWPTAGAPSVWSPSKAEVEERSGVGTPGSVEWELAVRCLSAKESKGQEAKGQEETYVCVWEGKGHKEEIHREAERLGVVGKTWEPELQQERDDQGEYCTQKLSDSSERPPRPWVPSGVQSLTSICTVDTGSAQ